MAVSSLIAAGLLPSSFTGTVEGYNFSVTTTGGRYGYSAAGLAATGRDNPCAERCCFPERYCFYNTPDAVVRYSMDPNLSPPGQGGLRRVSAAGYRARDGVGQVIDICAHGLEDRTESHRQGHRRAGFAGGATIEGTNKGRKGWPRPQTE